MNPIPVCEIAQEVNDSIHNLRYQFQDIKRICKSTKKGQAAENNFVEKCKFFDALKFIEGPTSSNETTIDLFVSLIIHILNIFILPCNFLS